MVKFLGKDVGRVGYGTMGLTWRDSPPPLDQALDALKAAVDSGCLLWSAAEFYGTPEYNSMTVLRHYFTKYPDDADKVTLVIKGAMDLATHKPDSSPEGIRRSMDNILEQLGGVKKVDAFASSRRDPNVPLATTYETLQKEYIDTGKLGGISLSECSAATIHEAAKLINVVTVEVEVSMFSPDILHNGIAAACVEHGIPIMGYSPIGRGLLTGKITSAEEFKQKGVAGKLPRYQEDSIKHNLTLVKQVQHLADKKGCTPGQLAVGWVSAIGRQPGMPEVLPIPGASAAPRVHENAKFVELTDDEYKAISDIVDSFKPAGGRYPDFIPTNT